MANKNNANDNSLSANEIPLHSNEVRITEIRELEHYLRIFLDRNLNLSSLDSATKEKMISSLILFLAQSQNREDELVFRNNLKMAFGPPTTDFLWENYLLQALNDVEDFYKYYALDIDNLASQKYLSIGLPHDFLDAHIISFTEKLQLIRITLEEHKKNCENKTGDKILDWLRLIESNSKLELNSKTNQLKIQSDISYLKDIIKNIRSDVKNNIIDESFAKNMLQHALVKLRTAATQNNPHASINTLAEAVNEILTSLKLERLEAGIEQDTTLAQINEIRKKISDLNQYNSENFIQDGIIGRHSTNKDSNENKMADVLHKADLLLEKLDKLVQINKTVAAQIVLEDEEAEKTLLNLQGLHETVFTQIKEKEFIVLQANSLLTKLNEIKTHEMPETLLPIYAAMNNRLKQLCDINKEFTLDDKIDRIKIIFTLRRIPLAELSKTLSICDKTIEAFKNIQAKKSNAPSRTLPSYSNNSSALFTSRNTQQHKAKNETHRDISSYKNK